MAGVGEPQHGEPLGEPFETGDRVTPRGQALTCCGQSGDGRRIGEPDMVGHPLRSLAVDDLAVGVRALPLPDALLLALHMPLPHDEQFVDGRIPGRGHRIADCGAKASGLARWVAACDELPDRVSADVATFESALSLREAIYRPAPWLSKTPAVVKPVPRPS